MQKVKLSDRARLPNKPGIYFAVHCGKVLYIGMAGKQGLRSRWTDNAGYGSHFKLWQLQQLEKHTRHPVFLRYEIRPLWRVAHDEAVAIDNHIKRRGNLPLLNRRRERRVWWIDLYDRATVLLMLIGCAIGLWYLTQ